LLLTHLRAEPRDREIEPLLRAKGASLNPLMLAKWSAFKWAIETSSGYPCICAMRLQLVDGGASVGNRARRLIVSARRSEG
jgi:hypothetical protein